MMQCTSIFMGRVRKGVFVYSGSKIANAFIHLIVSSFSVLNQNIFDCYKAKKQHLLNYF